MHASPWQKICLAVAIVTIASMPVAVGLGACSPFEEGDPVDAGTDQAREVTTENEDAADATVDGDAGFGSTPGIIECPAGDRRCETKTGERCCYDRDSGTSHCSTSCGSGDLNIGCDESADCAPGHRCCVTVNFFVLGNPECRMASKCDVDQLCRTSGECPMGVTCLPYPCRGSTIGTCGEPGDVVEAFCNE